jgi:cytochrome c oxidase subunit 2
MKKIINLAAALTFALVLSACGNASESGGSSTAAVPSEEANATEVKLSASNWEFDQAEYKIAKGQPVSFLLENEAGYHGVTIKGLGIDLEADKPEQYTITEAGTYEIICSIQCGSGHSTMKSVLIVE